MTHTICLITITNEDMSYNNDDIFDNNDDISNNIDNDNVCNNNATLRCPITMTI